jgi:hypothetical protein
VKLGLENKKSATWAAVLGVVALLVCGYEIAPLFMGAPTAASSPEGLAPLEKAKSPARGGKPGKKQKPVSLDPTLQLDLLASTENTQYEGNGRNIFVSQMEDIPQPITSGVIGHGKNNDPQQVDIYHAPPIPQSPPIPLKFYGFASSPGEPKKIFLKLGDDVFVAGEGEIVDRRYKVMRISAASVEIEDVVGSGPPQNIPLTQG